MGTAVYQNLLPPTSRELIIEHARSPCRPRAGRTVSALVSHSAERTFPLACVPLSLPTAYAHRWAFSSMLKPVRLGPVYPSLPSSVLSSFAARSLTAARAA